MKDSKKRERGGDSLGHALTLGSQRHDHFPVSLLSGGCLVGERRGWTLSTAPKGWEGALLTCPWSQP